MATTKNAKENVKKLQEELKASENQQILGWQVWWELYQAEGLHSELEKEAGQIGILHLVPDKLNPTRRMFQAMKRLRPSGIVFRQAGKTKGGWATWRAVELKRSTKNSAVEEQHKPNLKAQVLGAISVHTETGEVSLEEPDCEVGKAVVKEYERLEDHFTAWRVRNWILSVIDDLDGVPLRQSGGIYFIPRSDRAEKILPKLAEYIRTIGESDLYIPELPAVSEWKRAADRAATTSLETQYKEILAEVERFANTMDSGDLIDPRTLRAKIESAQTLRKKAGLFEEILSDRADSLANAAKALELGIKGILDESVEYRQLKRIKNAKAEEIVRNGLIALGEQMNQAMNEATEIHSPGEDWQEDFD